MITIGAGQKTAMVEIAVVWCSTIKFSRLRQCRISPQESDWMEPTIILLENAPELKHLIVDYTCTKQPENLPLSWNQPSFVPGCLSSQLETFEWEAYGGREEEEHFLAYVLANSNFLKTATISLGSSFSLEEKQMMIEGLKDIPKVSTEAKLVFDI
ncbi:PREDICTED: putative FBD-associated F-box protein At1g05080 isoform X2 [Camelina sativa]|uniref:FBD-associated F-box protein At1g05080 isoform X2 n=1 Tax=Camelina sativa TaxID=90675 RepID=A0ABM0VG68_CAMSA|nr:PREDICTED: putative FBD-associated F-box protein At1g05080 isoform X2 [Camelina sativa]